MTSSRQFKINYAKLTIMDFIQRNFALIFVLVIGSALLFLALIAHYETERKWYNSQTTYYDNSIEQIKIINKNY